MHPMIKPALRRGWRDRQTLQYGMAPAHAVLLGPVTDHTAALMDLMDGTRNMDQLQEEARRLGLGPHIPQQLTERLATAGLLDDATADREASAAISDRLRPDLASLSVVHHTPGSAVQRLATRRSARIQVRGAGRVGTTVAATLAAAGVGQVDVIDGGDVEPWDTAPGGLPPHSVGSRRDAAARTAVGQWRDGRNGNRARVGLVLITPRDGADAYAPDPRTAEPFMETGTPHLYGGVAEATGIVGPLVLPGITPCADCLMRGRTEREPSWPLLVGQWRTANRRRTGTPACDIALATTTAGILASYALSYIDGDGGCTSGYRLRLALPHLLPSTEQFTAHDECPCGAASVHAARTGSETAEPHATMTG